MTSTRAKARPASPQPVNCYECQHHFITHDKKKPYGCRAFGFKGPMLPSRTVFATTGTECAYFTLKTDVAARWRQRS